MSKKMGIPRIFLHFRYGDSLEYFLKCLGIETVYSQSIDGATELDEFIDEEACLPLKSAASHLQNLLDSDVEKILVPQWISSRKKKFFCPKILGFPELARNVDPERIIILPINFYNGIADFFPKLYGFSKSVKKPFLRVLKAFFLSLIYYRKNKNHKQISHFTLKSNKIRIGLLGNPYVLHDSSLNLGLIKLLEKNSNIEIIYPEMIKKELLQNISCSADFWGSYQDTVSTGLAMLTEYQVNGIIQLVSFGCGPDSMLSKILELEFHQRGFFSYLRLVLDEHDGLAGYKTRLEAFLDMLRV